MFTLAESDIGPFSPSTWIALGAAVFSVAGAILGWWFSRRERRAAMEAAERATNQETFRNLAEKAIADAMEKRNAIVQQQADAAKELLEHEKEKASLSWEIKTSTCMASYLSEFSIIIRNTSLALPLALNELKVRLGSGWELRPTILTSQGDPSDIQPQKLCIVRFPLMEMMTVQPDGTGGQLSHRAVPMVQFQHSGEWFDCDSDQWRRFLRAGITLQTFMQTHPEKSHGPGLGWDLAEFTY